MSLNQSRFDKNESQSRKPGGGRSGTSSGAQQRSFSGGRGRGGIGAPTTTTSNPNRSYKKINNAQGRDNSGPVNASESSAVTSLRSVENGAHAQPSLHVSNASPSAVATKPADASYQKTSRPHPKPPSQPSAMNTNSSTPTKGDGTPGFSLQFGSLSPGLMNGMQVPARTSSAPPNLDEQKQDQARRDAPKAVPAIPLPTVSKLELPKKDVTVKKQPETQEINNKTKRDVNVTSAPPSTHAQKPSALPAGGKSVPLPFHQAAVSMQFGGPSPQVQSQGMPNSTLQMPMQMPLQMGNSSQVPQQVFMTGLHNPIMQTQGIIHHGQNLGFSPPLAPHLPHQLGGNLGLNMSTQYNQQPGKFGSTRKTVKITHPDTHEELRLDSRDSGSSTSGARPSGASSQPQPVSAYTAAHSMGYYSSSYTTSPPFFPVQSSISLTNAQLNVSSQGPRFNYSVSQAPPNMPYVNQPASNTYSVSRVGAPVRVTTESSSFDNAHDAHSMASTAQRSTPITVKAAAGSAGKVINPNDVVGPEPVKVSNPAVEPSVVIKKLDVHTEKSSISLKSTDPAMTPSVAFGTSIQGKRSVILGRTGESPPTNTNVVKGDVEVKSSPIRDVEKLYDKEGHLVPSHQVGGQSDSRVRQDLADSSKVLISESAEANHMQTSSDSKIVTFEAGHVSPIIASAVPSDVHGLNRGSECPSYSSESSEAHGGVDEVAKDHPAIPSELPLHEDALKLDELEEPSPDNNLESSNILKKSDQDGQVTRTGGVDSVVEAPQTHGESQNYCIGGDKLVTESSSLGNGATASDKYSVSNSTSQSCVMDGVSSKGNDIMKSDFSDNEATSANLTEAHLAQEGESLDNPRPSSSGSSSGASKTSIEPNKTKNRGKKKLKELLQKADAQGTTADLYMAYKGPEEKKEAAGVTSDITTENNTEEISGDHKLEEGAIMAKDEQTKSELDNWEDATEISTLKLESSVNSVRGSINGEEGVTAKKYSRDFLLTFAAQCTDLPGGFVITADIADSLMSVNHSISRSDREYSSPGRITDRPVGTNRPDRRGSGTMDAARWNKQPVPFNSVRDPGMDLAYTTNMMGFHTGPGPNYGMLKNPRAQGPVPHAGGILSGPMHPVGYQGLQRNNSDADRWQRGTNFHKGLMPPPGPSQVMHKAVNKYEIGKVSDEEQAKQRKLKSILNKLTPQNFEKLFEQVKEVNIDNAVTLSGVISQIFDKALMEPTFCEMYANFCQHLASELPELSVDNEKVTFRRLLLNKCQEEFERGEREEQEATKADNEGEDETKQSEGVREEMRLKARRRMLGNIRLIGELYKKKMLTERIMHECIKKLLGQYQNPDEENIEALCKLMSTIGEMIDHPKAKDHMDAYFDIMGQLSNNMQLSSRVRFMLKDVIDLRKNKWQQRMKVEGPKKIDEVHRDAAQERLGQAGRLSRGPSMNSSVRRGQPMEFGPRGTMLPSPIGQGGGFRAMPPQVRGFGGQDERNIYESRTLSVPLPQRLSSDQTITLGPQGGLARNMVYRGQLSMSNSSLLDSSPSYADSRRMVGGLNGYSNDSERGMHSSREDHFARNAYDRFGAPIAQDQSSSQGINTNKDARYPDRSSDRTRPITPPVERAAPSQNVASDRVLPEERLREMSIAAIREYYSAKDEKEVVLCIRDLNSPSFYPSVVSIWVTDSFERKDLERDMLSKLLVNLARPREGLFSSGQLVEGFKYVLTNLEDTVTDAPKAPEFLGQMFARVVIENVIPLQDVGELIYEGGEEPGSLREVGLAAEILGSVLEMIKHERGESVLNEIRARSELRLEDFRLPGSFRSRKLEMFI